MRNKLTDVTADEMRKFVGLILHMGLVSLPSYDLYWSTNRLYKNTFFSSVMSREKFQAIMRFWHFGENPESVDDRLSKVRYVVNHIRPLCFRNFH